MNKTEANKQKIPQKANKYLSYNTLEFIQLYRCLVAAAATTTMLLLFVCLFCSMECKHKH